MNLRTVAYKIQLVGKTTAKVTIPHNLKSHVAAHEFKIFYSFNRNSPLPDDRGSRPIIKYSKILDENYPKEKSYLNIVSFAISPSVMGNSLAFAIPRVVMKALDLKVGDYLKLEYSLFPVLEFKYTYLSFTEALKLWEEKNRVNAPSKPKQQRKRIYENHDPENQECIEGRCSHRTFLKSIEVIKK